VACEHEVSTSIYRIKLLLFYPVQWMIVTLKITIWRNGSQINWVSWKKKKSRQSSNQLYSKSSGTAGWVFWQLWCCDSLPSAVFLIVHLIYCHVCFSHEGLNKWKRGFYVGKRDFERFNNQRIWRHNVLTTWSSKIYHNDALWFTLLCSEKQSRWINNK